MSKVIKPLVVARLEMIQSVTRDPTALTPLIYTEHHGAIKRSEQYASTSQLCREC